MKPNFFIVGGPKCGTTAWVEYLGSHPDIYFPARKEPSYFCPDLLPIQRVQTLSEYLDLFRDSGDAAVVGEASVTYLRSEVAPGQIHAFDEQAKILIFLRDQESFLPSLHNQLVFNGEELIDDFEQAWRLSGQRTREQVPACCNDIRSLDYKEAGRFSDQIRRYLDQFPADQIRVFHFKDWISNPRSTYLNIMDFLGLEDDGREDFPRVNEAKHRKSKLLLRLVKDPPPALLGVAATAKKIAGVSSLGIASRLLKVGTREGNPNRVSDALKREIRHFYAADNALTQSMIDEAGRVWHREAELS